MLRVTGVYVIKGRNQLDYCNFALECESTYRLRFLLLL